MAMTSFQSDIVSRQIDLCQRVMNLRDQVAQFRLVEANSNWSAVTNEDFAARAEFDHHTKPDQNTSEQALGRIVAAIDLELATLSKMLRP